MPWCTWSILRSRARNATVSELRLVIIPVLMPAARAKDIPVPSWAWKPLASIRLVLCEPPGAGNIQILPSVKTPSTSKIMSLILRARAMADGSGIAAILAGQQGKIRQPSDRSGSRVFQNHDRRKLTWSRRANVLRNLSCDLQLIYAVRSLPFASLGPSAGSGVVHCAVLHADRTAGTRLASHSRWPHYADLGPHWIG